MTDESMMELRRMVGDAMLDDAFTDSLVADLDSGEIPIVLTRTEEHMSVIFEQLGENGGTANFVYRWEGGLAVLKLWERDEPPAAGEPVQPVGITATLGTLLSVMSETDVRQMVIVPAAPLEGHTFLGGSRHTVPAVGA
jgi:hypothetical protein